MKRYVFFHRGGLAGLGDLEYMLTELGRFVSLADVEAIRKRADEIVVGDVFGCGRNARGEPIAVVTRVSDAEEDAPISRVDLN